MPPGFYAAKVLMDSEMRKKKKEKKIKCNNKTQRLFMI